MIATTPTIKDLAISVAHLSPAFTIDGSCIETPHSLINLDNLTPTAEMVLCGCIEEAIGQMQARFSNLVLDALTLRMDLHEGVWHVSIVLDTDFVWRATNQSKAIALLEAYQKCLQWMSEQGLLEVGA